MAATDERSPIEPATAAAWHLIGSALLRKTCSVWFTDTSWPFSLNRVRRTGSPTSIRNAAERPRSSRSARIPTCSVTVATISHSVRPSASRCSAACTSASSAAPSTAGRSGPATSSARSFSPAAGSSRLVFIGSTAHHGRSSPAPWACTPPGTASFPLTRSPSAVPSPASRPSTRRRVSTGPAPAGEARSPSSLASASPRRTPSSRTSPSTSRRPVSARTAPSPSTAKSTGSHGAPALRAAPARPPPPGRAGSAPPAAPPPARPPARRAPGNARKLRHRPTPTACADLLRVIPCLLPLSHRVGCSFQSPLDDSAVIRPSAPSAWLAQGASKPRWRAAATTAPRPGVTPSL